VRRLAAAAVVLGLLLLSGCGGDAAAKFSGTRLDEPYDVPATALTDTDGEPFSLTEDTEEPLTLVFFGYTHCPDVCNTVLADVAAALRRMDPAARSKIQLVFLTTDPARDTPRVIREYLDRFEPAFVGLTGPLPVIERVAAALGVPLTGMRKLPGGGYEVGHGAQVIGFTSDDAGRLVWTHPTPVRDLRHDFGKLAQAA
jgi:protein SCO1